MFCTRCGTALSQDAVSCQKCGAKVESTAKETATNEMRQSGSNLLNNLRSRESLLVTRIVAWVCVATSAATLIVGVLMVTLAGLDLLGTTEVSLKEVQGELGKKNVATGLSAELDALKGQFAHLDDQRWTQARELIGGWVEQWSAEPKGKARFLAEIKAVAVNFPQEQRSTAVDTFYRLKQEKRAIAALRQQNSWFLQLGTSSSILVSLLVFGIFSLLLILIKIEKNTRGIETGKR